MKYLIAKMADKINEHYQTGEITYSNFLDPSEIVEISYGLKNVEHVFFGGYEDAERKVAFVGTEEDSNLSEYLSYVRMTPNDKKYGQLTHRSILGTVLGLGIKREMIGDIIIGDDFCDIIVMKSILEFLLNQIKMIGRIKVSVKEIKREELLSPKNEVKEIKTSVSSLRIDSIISAGFGISREKSSTFVREELVKVNHIPIKSITKLLKEGDIISVRGKRKT